MSTRFVLYVAGESARSTRAAANMRRLCAAASIGEDQLEIVDVLERPDRADDAGILATPTVIATSTHSTRRVIGDLSELSRLASALDVDLPPHPQGDPR